MAQGAAARSKTCPEPGKTAAFSARAGGTPFLSGGEGPKIRGPAATAGHWPASVVR